jgi:acetate kinase
LVEFRRDVLRSARHVAVFDTAFHAALPRHAYLYGLPIELYRRDGIRRYGFHGTSHDVVSERLAERLGRPREELRIVTLHLGNGASAAAVRYGVSVDTTMGFTPLEGLMMGTRSGDVDPGILIHLLRGGADVAELDDLLNRRSGVLGLSGVSNDLRDVRAAADGGDETAAAALEAYAYRIRTTIAAMAAAMGGLDALVFTGGVGENDARTREEACRELGFLGIEIDPEANASHGPRIGRDGARVETWVIPTDEEGRIAELARAATAKETP